MKNKYIDLIDQTFEFPQDEFMVEDGELHFHDINMMDIINQYGTPLKITYLPKISSQIQRAKRMFNVAMAKVDYKGTYNYCYCTKSSHFEFVLKEALKNDIHLETSSAFDLNLIEALEAEGIVNRDQFIVCNGFKKPAYIENIANFANNGWKNIIPVLDNMRELEALDALVESPINIGIRIASEEDPTFDFYTSRLGIRYSDIVPFYENMISKSKKFKLKMLHFFINTGMRDTAYYWNELAKCVGVYCDLKLICPELDSMNIGGGFPIKNSLASDFDYEYMAEEIISQIKLMCNARGVAEPNIFTEFGSFTVGESGATIFQILDMKQQNDRERWYMIDSSIMLITHDLGVIAHMADYVVVMYAGRIVEKGTKEDIFHNPIHPYTIGLMKSKPAINKKVDSLYNIRGNVPNPINMPNHCYFKDRCDFCTAKCDDRYPPMFKVSDTHYVSCYRVGEEGEFVEYPKTVDPEVLLNEL